MRLAAATFASLAALAPAPALYATTAVDAIRTPSGLTVTFHDVVTDAPGLGLAYRFRFVAPDLDPAADYVTTEADLVWLCHAFALPRLAEIGPAPDRIVISLADRPVPFGETAPEAVQFFEAYALQGTECVWQGF